MRNMKENCFWCYFGTCVDGWWWKGMVKEKVGLILGIIKWKYLKAFVNN